MLKRFRIVGLCLMAVFAVSAVGASSAMAEHLEVGKCKSVAAGTGKWEDSNCTKALVGGNFEWETYAEAIAKGANPAFTSTSGEKILTLGSTSIKCKKDKNVGKLTSATKDEVTITFEECTALGGLVSCNSAGSGAGTIVTKKLKSLLVWVKHTAPLEVGLALEPEAGFFTAEITCATVKILVRGSLIGVITPINTMSTMFNLAVKVSGGNQVPSEYEVKEGEVWKKVPDTLECSTNGGTTWAACTEEEVTADKITFTESWEIWAASP